MLSISLIFLSRTVIETFPVCPPALLFHWFLENRKPVSFTPFLEIFGQFQLNCQLHEFLVSLFREDLDNENGYQGPFCENDLVPLLSFILIPDKATVLEKRTNIFVVHSIFIYIFL